MKSKTPLLTIIILFLLFRGSGIGSGSSVALPIMYDASEEDLMNTIEREFG